MAYVQKLVTQESFDARGVLVPAGHIAVFDEDRLNGEEEHIKDVGDFQPARVEVSAIAPTGPNPVIPQQVPPDAIQDPGGLYSLPGKTLVAEVTKPAEVRIDQAGLGDPDAEPKVDAMLGDIMDSAASATPAVDGTVADVTANLGTQTDEQLRATLAAEKDGKNRKGVVDAVQAELDSRTA